MLNSLMRGLDSPWGMALTYVLYLVSMGGLTWIAAEILGSVG